MLNPTYEQLSPFLEDYKVIPVCRTIYADIITPINLLRKLAIAQPIAIIYWKVSKAVKSGGATLFSAMTRQSASPAKTVTSPSAAKVRKRNLFMVILMKFSALS